MPPSSTPSDPSGLLSTVKRTLETHRMLAPGDRVLVGVSGGIDSMVLLHLLIRLASERRIRIGVAHLNHRLRGEAADSDADVVRREAERLDIPCHSARAHINKVKQKLGLSLEDASRRVRYAFFKKVMVDEGYNKLALGHQLDDNAELMLIFLLRGAGPLGLSGIAPVRDNRIIRPMIQARRSQIMVFASQENIPYVTDASNDDLRFVRNRIRHRLLPLLETEYSPHIKDHLNRVADLMRTESSWIDGQVAVVYPQSLLYRKPDRIALSITALAQVHPALVRRIIRKTLKDLTGTLRRITFSHVQSVMYMLAKNNGEKTVHLPGGIRVSRTGDRLVVYRDAMNRRDAVAATPNPVSETRIDGPFPCTVNIQAMGIGFTITPCLPHQLPLWAEIGPNQAFFDFQRLSLPLTVRHIIPGDRFTPLGVTGSQKVKKFFIDHGIPRRNRVMTPVLTDRKGIVWIVGYRIDDHVKVTAATSQVLQVEFFLLDTR